MIYDILKSLHLIFVVTWFAGLFYIVRLFIYHTESREKPEEERRILNKQFTIMEKRLWYGITWPSAILTLLFGLSMIHNFFPLTAHPWLMVKIAFVILLFLYHLSCGRILKQIQLGKSNWTGMQLRMWNEVATIFLVAIVFLVILKSVLHMGYGLLGLVVLMIVLMAAIRFYKAIRSS